MICSVTYEQGAMVAYVFTEESTDGFLWRGHPGVVEIDLGDGDYSVAFHRSLTNEAMDVQLLAPLTAQEFAARIAAIDRGERPVELGRRLPQSPPGGPRVDDL
jgi:hypothetical protein